MKWIIIRHAESNWNKKGIFQGQKNPKLSSNGLIQASKIHLGLKGLSLDYIYSSDLERAKNSKWFWPFANDKESIQKEEKVKIERRVKIKTDNKTKWFWPFTEEKESSETEKQVKAEGKKKSRWYWPFD